MKLYVIVINDCMHSIQQDSLAKASLVNEHHFTKLKSAKFFCPIQIFLANANSLDFFLAKIISWYIDHFPGA